MLLQRYSLHFVFVMVFVRESRCACEKSYSVICDSFSDLADYHYETTSWRHVIIGSSDHNDSSHLQAIHLQSEVCRLSNVVSLTIISQMNAINTSGVSIVNTVRFLTLYKNEIETIQDHTFAAFEKLEDVDMEDNKIQRLGQEIFGVKCSLQVVNLANNQLVSIRSSFSNCAIRQLLLNHNKLSTVAAQDFPSKLEKLDMSYNTLSHLYETPFRAMQKLKYLVLTNNKLDKIPDLNNVQQLRFLDLSYNEIVSTSYTSFERKDKLMFVNLAFNLLEEVSLKDFYSSKRSTLLILAYNRLTDLKIDYPDVNKINFVIDGNPWCCDSFANLTKTLGPNQIRKLDFFASGRAPVCIECIERRKKFPKVNIDSYLSHIESFERNVSQEIKMLTNQIISETS